MRQVPRIQHALRPALTFARKVLGQVRPLTELDDFVLVGLRKGAAELPHMLDALEERLSARDEVAGAWFVPPLDRLIVLRSQDAHPRSARKVILDCIVQAEKDFDLHRNRFPTQSGLPDLSIKLPRLYVEMGMDLASFGAGLLVRKVGRRPYYAFSEMSAVNQLFEYTPQLREQLDSSLGRGNAELLFRVLGNVSEGFSQGWSGSLVDLGQRYLQWQSEAERARCWQGLSEDALASITRLPKGLRPPAARIRPIPPGAIEQYQDTAKTLSLGAFSSGMAFSHDLNRSMATLFFTTPKPLFHGRAAFRRRLTREFAFGGVLILKPDIVDILDRVDRIIVDGSIVAPSCLVAKARFPEAKDPLPVGKLDQILKDEGSQETGTSDDYKCIKPSSRPQVPAEVREWWESSDEPLAALRLIKRKGKLCDAVLVQKVSDKTVESLLHRARELGLKVSILAANDETAGRKMRDHQARGETLLALGDARLLRFADIGIGLITQNAAWPANAHILTKNPLDTFWRLLSGIEQARLMANQSVQLAKIDAISGLILSLESINERLMGRIRLAADIVSFAALTNGYRLARHNTALPVELLDDPTPWHAMEQDLVLERLEHKREIQPRLLPPDQTSPSLFRFWLDEMRNPLTPALMAGTGLAVLTGAVGDGLLISTVVGINGLVGGLQRRQTDRQLKALGMTLKAPILTRRNHQTTTVAPEELQPGDEIELVAGELVPADARIISAEALEVDESSLTGESLPVKKSAKPCDSINLAERYSMLYEGSTIVEGKVRAVVVAAKILSESNRAQYIRGSSTTGVEVRLDELTRMTLPLAAFSGLALLLNGLSRERPVREVVSSGVSLAVAAVPEGLPILATLSQLAAAQRLSKGGALARNPRAVEALGRMTVLCADKTGTLTQGKLALRTITIASEEQSAEGMDERAGEILLISAMASPETRDGEKLFHATDQALNEAVKEHKSDITQAASSWTRMEEMPFKSTQFYHATLVQKDRRKRICVKGAPDEVLKRCNRWQREDGQVKSMDADKRKDFEDQFYSMAQQGLRILAVAERPARSLTLEDKKIHRLVFRGFVAIADPVRGAARESVDRLRSAGIRTKMITGDHPETAAAIGRDLGLNVAAGVLTGDDIDSMSTEQLTESVLNVEIFARVTPSQKATLVKALQDAGEVVGMTGDGANDAAAIRLADVGIALGRDSSEAAQQAADLLVLDPRIETIVDAVQEGRALWSSVRDAVSLLVGGNLGEIGFTLVAGLLEGGTPLNARQLLLINLITDTFPALAVALRRPQKPKAQSLMAQGPESALGESLTREIQWRAGLTAGMATGSWALSRLLQNPQRASTVGMLTVIGGQLAQTIVAGEASRGTIITSTVSMAALGLVVQTPGLSRMFGCSSPGLVGWSLVGGSLVLSFVGSRYLPFVDKTCRQWEQELIERLERWITGEGELESIEAPG